MTKRTTKKAAKKSPKKLSANDKIVVSAVRYCAAMAGKIRCYDADGGDNKFASVVGSKLYDEAHEALLRVALQQATSEQSINAKAAMGLAMMTDQISYPGGFVQRTLHREEVLFLNQFCDDVRAFVHAGADAAG